MLAQCIVDIIPRFGLLRLETMACFMAKRSKNFFFLGILKHRDVKKILEILCRYMGVSAVSCLSGSRGYLASWNGALTNTYAEQRLAFMGTINCPRVVPSWADTTIHNMLRLDYFLRYQSRTECYAGFSLLEKD